MQQDNLPESILPESYIAALDERFPDEPVLIPEATTEPDQN